jgi:tetratricopeptide (TPR) repeat protein
MGVQRHPRHRVNVPVGVIVGLSDVESLSLDDISLGGAFIRTPRPRDPGSRLRLEMPGVSIGARVVHVIDAGNAMARAPGMGVEFDEVTAEVAKLVDDLKPSDDVAEALDEAAFLARTGLLEEAQAVLLEAPDVDTVRAQLAVVNNAIDGAHGRDLLRDVDAIARRTDKIKRVRTATAISSSRDVLLKAMRIAASTGAHDDLVEIAEQLVELDEHDELPLFALLHVHEQRGDVEDALRAAEKLAKLRPDDLALIERIDGLRAARR